MSLVVKLEDDLGERSEWVMLHGIVPANPDGAYPLLSGIDAFGKTVFNHLQMAAFLAEWDRVKDRARDESLRAEDVAADCVHRMRSLSITNAVPRILEPSPRGELQRLTSPAVGQGCHPGPDPGPDPGSIT